MDELKTEAEKQETSQQNVPEPQPKRINRRYVAIAVVMLTLVSIAAALVRRGETRSDQSAAPQPAAAASSDVVEATPEQLKQIRVEPVREQSVDLDLETTGKVGFDEDRMTPVFAPYSGRV